MLMLTTFSSFAEQELIIDEAKLAEYFDEAALDIHSDQTKIAGEVIYTEYPETGDVEKAARKKPRKFLKLFKESLGPQCQSEWVILNKHESKKIKATVKFWIPHKPGINIRRVSLEPGDEKSLGLACFGCRHQCRAGKITGARWSS